MKKHWLILTLKNKKLANIPEVKKWLNETRNILESTVEEKMFELGAYGSTIHETKTT